MLQLFGLPSVESRGDGERGIHSDYACVEIKLGHALETPGGTFLNAYAAAFTVIDENLVEAVRTDVTHNAGLGTNQITIVAGVAGTAAEAAAGFFDRLFFRVRLDDLLLRFAP